MDNLFDDVAVPATIEKAQVENVRAELAPVLELAKNIVITDMPTYESAVKLSQECTRRSKKVEAEFADAKEKAHQAHKAITDLISSFTKPLGEARKMIDNKAGQWFREEKARQEAEAARIQREEEKRLEEEKLRLAVTLEESGNKEAAAHVMEEQIVVAAPKIEKPTVAGSAYVENWQGRVVDENLLPREYTLPDLSKLGKITKALKSATNIPGWEVYDAGTFRHGK